MAVAVYVHSIIMKNPFVDLTGGLSYELASVYLCIAIVFLVLGPGKFSIDGKLFGERTVAGIKGAEGKRLMYNQSG